MLILVLNFILVEPYLHLQFFIFELNVFDSPFDFEYSSQFVITSRALINEFHELCLFGYVAELFEKFVNHGVPINTDIEFTFDEHFRRLRVFSGSGLQLSFDIREHRCLSMLLEIRKIKVGYGVVFLLVVLQKHFLDLLFLRVRAAILNFDDFTKIYLRTFWHHLVIILTTLMVYLLPL